MTATLDDVALAAQLHQARDRIQAEVRKVIVGQDAVLEQARRTFDRAERKAQYDRLQEILNEEQPYTFLYVAYALPIVHKRFHGIDPAPAGISHNFNAWYVPASAQKYRISETP